MTRVIMYHYIREFDKDFPYFDFLHKKDFKKQINWLKKKFKIIKNNEGNIKDKTILTFDDGTKDHLWVAKYLKSINLSGIFFISTYPLITKDFLNVHKVHLILGKYSTFEVEQTLKKFKISDNSFKKNDLNNIKLYQIQQAKTIEEIKKIKIKQKLNFFVKNKKTKIIDKLFKHFFNKNERKKIFKNFYLTKKDIINMRKNGMKIGSHSYSHNILSKLTYSKQYEEINQNHKNFKKLFAFEPKEFCYPYGGKKSYNKHTLNILKKLDYKFGYSVENKIFSYSDDNLEIPRFNCNFFRHGKIFKKK